MGIVSITTAAADIPNSTGWSVVAIKRTLLILLLLGPRNDCVIYSWGESKFVSRHYLLLITDNNKRASWKY